jgi:hypothetical protein
MEISPRKVLQAAAEKSLREVLVISEEMDGTFNVAASTNVDVAAAMLLMERAKQHLLALYATYEREDDPPPPSE